MLLQREDMFFIEKQTRTTSDVLAARPAGASPRLRSPCTVAGGRQGSEATACRGQGRRARVCVCRPVSPQSMQGACHPAFVYTNICYFVFLDVRVTFLVMRPERKRVSGSEDGGKFSSFICNVHNYLQFVFWCV